MKIKFLALLLLGALLLTGCTTEATTVTVTQTVTKTVTESITVTQTVTPTTTAVTATTTPIDTANLPIPTPANGAMNISTKTAFKWQPVDGATEYEIEISDNSQMNNPVYKVNTSVNYLQLRQGFSLFTIMKYYWRVRAISPTFSEWQNYSFYTQP
jgi:hypothetical protein